MSVPTRYRFENIPLEVKARDAWVTFQEIMHPGRSKADKPPFIAGSHTRASSTNGYTWRAFVDAERDVRIGRKSGVGYCLQDSGLVAIDLDRVRDPASGWIVPWAVRLVERFASYADISVSGTGLHILARGRLPSDSRHKIEFSDDSVLEIWDSGRYLAMTGNLVGPEFSTIRDHDFTNFWAELEETMKVYAPFRDGAQIDLEAWLNSNSVRILSKKLENGKTTFEIECPGTHGDYPRDDGKGFAIQFSNGALACGCQHSSCSFSKETGNHWSELRTRYEPRAASHRTHITNGNGSASENADDGSWHAPEPLGGELPPVPAFDLRLLPEALRTLVQDTSERMQVPLDFPAIASVLCHAGVVGRRGFIQPKAEDSEWIVVPNLWGALIGLPGIMMKSPTINTMTKPLTSIEKLWRSLFEAAKGEYEHEKEIMDLRLAAWKQLFVAAEKDPKKASPIRPDASIAKPVLKRLIVHDVSPEKLHEILCENPAGVLMIRDELAGWMARLDEEGHGGERQFFLTLWNGDTPYSVDRIGRGSLYGEACCMSLLGGIQPSRLRNYLADALYDGPQNDGLFQRLQLMVYPDPIKEWMYTDRLPQREAIANARRLYQRLVELDVEQPRLYKFDPLAQELFVDWLTKLEQNLRNAELHPALVSHISKYRSLMPSLALLFQLADDEPDESFEGFGSEGGRPLSINKPYLVSLEHARQAAAFCEYLEAHAHRVYSMIISPERAAAAELGRRLAEGWKRAEGTFTVREVYRNDWSRLDTPERVRPALEILEDAGWVRQIESERPTGRPSEVYAINPRLQRKEDE